MHILDLILILFPLVIVAASGLYAQKYVKSVADFMSGGRAAGRYLLAVAGGELQAGAVVFVALFEVISHSGFITIYWWTWLSAPVGLIIAISGFVKYRYRETRAMTLAQFFEIRYSKRFRLFTGILGFLAGILNFGIIPAIGARCLVYFLGLPPILHVFSFEVETYIPLMAVLLSITLFVALSGGVITVMVINCVEGIMSQLIYLIIIGTLLMMFNWRQISTVLEAPPAGHSLLNPFDSMGVKDFNLWYVLMTIFLNVYGTMAWQNSAAYNSAAFSPHESRMGGILSNWREMGKAAVIVLLGVCALTYLHHPDFSTRAAQVMTSVHQISDPQTQEQMEAPVAIAHFLPIGVKGLFCAILLMGVFGGDATHLHSWGSIFVQDVIVPRLKAPFGPQQHIWALRCSITGVALFAFLFGSLYRQVDYVAMWWAVTTAIFVGGSGSAIIGGLYWKRGTTQGAWAALIVGSSLSAGGIILRQIYDHFPLNPVQISFFSSLIAIALYVVVSLLTYQKDFNMDRMLHRGAYASLKPLLGEEILSPHRPTWWNKLIGFDQDFSLGDKWIAGSLLGWGILLFVVFIIGTTWNFVDPWPLSVWSTFWNVIGIGIPVFFAFVTGIWFTWGGIKDMRDLFRRLSQEKINHLDDGTVVNHRNLDELTDVATRLDK
jgi:solute:Na+ symporter, SSS family